jgi:Domain of unknown function (DUF1707)
VTPWPEDQMPATGRGHLAASDADRDHTTEVLKAAFVEGRLTKDELDTRVSQALTARTHAKLAALTTDLPAELITVRPPRQPLRPRVNKAAKVAICVTIVAALLAAAVLSGPGNGSDRLFFLLATIPEWSLPIGALLVFHSLLRRRARRAQLAEYDEAFESEQMAGPPVF